MKLATSERNNVRQGIYAAGLIGVGITLLLQVCKVIDPTIAGPIITIIQGLGTLSGTGALATVVKVLSAQKRMPGMLEPTTGSPLEQIADLFTGLVTAESDAAEQHAGAMNNVEQAKQLAATTFGQIPGPRDLADIVTTAQSLASQVNAAVAAVNSK